MSQSGNGFADKMLMYAGDISGKRILDLCCGRGKWACVLRAENQKDDSNPAYIVGMEVFKPYIRYARKHGSIDRVMEVNLEKLDKLPFKDRSFDIVMMTESIEHMDKSTGLRMMMEMQRVSREKVFISAPPFWHPHAKYDGNIHQLAKCHWELEEFEQLGFRVQGLGFYLNITNTYGIQNKFCALFSWVGHFWRTHASDWMVTKEVKA